MSEERDETAEQQPKKDLAESLLEKLDDLEFSLDLAEYPVKIKDKDGKVSVFRIVELDQAKREEYMDFQAKKAKYTDGKVSGLKDIKGMDSKLVSLSLVGPDGSNVPEAVVLTWPGSLARKLAAVAARISGLDEKAEQQAKNS